MMSALYLGNVISLPKRLDQLSRVFVPLRKMFVDTILKFRLTIILTAVANKREKGLAAKVNECFEREMRHSLLK